MIRKAVLRNFQIHEKSVLVFKPGLNIIRGESDQGKSAIAKAFRWAITNRPQGGRYITKGLDKKAVSSVKIVMDEGTIVRERNGSTLNQYVLDDSEIFKAMKQDVPDELASVFRMNDVNCHTQFQPFFLLGETPGKVAEKLNKIVGLDEIDSVIKNINSYGRTIRNKMDLLSEQRQKLEKQYEALPDYDAMEERAEDIRKRDLQIRGMSSSADNLKDLIASSKTATKEIRKYERLTNHSVTVDELCNRASKLNEMQAKCDDLKRTLDTLAEYRDTIDVYERETAVEQDVQALLASVRELIDVKQEKKELGNLLSAIKVAANDEDYCEKSIKVHTARLAGVMATMKTCPICGTTIDDKLVNKMVGKVFDDA